MPVLPMAIVRDSAEQILVDESGASVVKASLDHQMDDVQPSSMTVNTSKQATLSVTSAQRSHVGHKINILRSPSRESVGTDISLFSVSTFASELTSRVKLLSVRMPTENAAISRGPSPNFDCKRFKRPEDIQEIWFEEPNDMIRGMAALSSAVGLSKSFSTSDMINLPDSCMGGGEEEGGIAIGADHNSLFLLLNGTRRNTVSELALSSIRNSGYLLEQSIKLQNSSRSCSTWVAVGDIPSTSQLPSPHGGNLPTTLQTSKPSYMPAFSPVDLIRSVNKKVRQQYIRRRLLNTYRALERLSQSEFNLDKLEVEAAANANTAIILSEKHADPAVDCASTSSSNRLSVPNFASSVKRQWKTINFLSSAEEKLTINDVERERGQPLSKYDRNMMIFNWLLTLEPDENTNNSIDSYPVG